MPTTDVAQASEDNDDILRIVQPRLQVIRGQRLRQRIREVIEGRLRIDGPGDGTLVSDISTLGATVSPVAASAGPLWGTWADVNYTYLDSDFTGTEFDGHQVGVGAGIDYAVTDRVILGVSLEYENSDTDNSIGPFAPGNLKTDTITVGPYIGISLTDILVFDAAFNYSWTDNDISDTISTGDFNSESWNVSGNLTAYVPVTDALTVSPTVGLSYSRSRDEAYTDNIGFSFPSQVIYSGTLNFGGSISYYVDLGEGRSMEPSLSVEGTWEFDLFGKPPLDVGFVSNANDGNVDVSISSAVDFVLSDTTSLSLTGSVGGLARDQYIELSGGGQLTVQF